MTKEELEKEAEEYTENPKSAWKQGMTCVGSVRQAYKDGAESREKRIADLETENNKLLDVINNQDVKIADLVKQIEKMKCCENCKYNSYWGNELHCNYGLKEALQEDKLVECNKMDKWEIK